MNKTKDRSHKNKNETKNQFDGAIDSSWYLPNSFYDWIPSVEMSGTDDQTVIISLLQLDKQDTDLRYKDDHLIISSKLGGKRGKDDDLSGLIFKHVFQLAAPSSINRIHFKFKNGDRELTLIDEKTHPAIAKIEIHIPWSCMNVTSFKLN